MSKSVEVDIYGSLKFSNLLVLLEIKMKKGPFISLDLKDSKNTNINILKSINIKWTTHCSDNMKIV